MASFWSSFTITLTMHGHTNAKVMKTVNITSNSSSECRPDIIVGLKGFSYLLTAINLNKVLATVQRVVSVYNKTYKKKCRSYKVKMGGGGQFTRSSLFEELVSLILHWQRSSNSAQKPFRILHLNTIYHLSKNNSLLVFTPTCSDADTSFSNDLRYF